MRAGDRVIAVLARRDPLRVGWTDGSQPLFTGDMIDAAEVTLTDRDGPARVFVTLDPAVALLRRHPPSDRRATVTP